MNKLTVMESACVFYSKSLKVSEIILSGWPKCTDCTDFLFCNPKIVRIVRIFFSNCTDFYPGNTPVF